MSAEGNESHYESENRNFTFVVTKCTFLRFHRALLCSKRAARRAERRAARRAQRSGLRPSTRLACAHPRLHNRPPTRARPRALASARRSRLDATCASCTAGACCVPLGAPRAQSDGAIARSTLLCELRIWSATNEIRFYANDSNVSP